MTLFKTSNTDVVKCCQDHFGFNLPSVSCSKRVKKFEAKFHAGNNLLCTVAAPEGKSRVGFSLCEAAERRRREERGAETSAEGARVEAP